MSIEELMAQCNECIEEIEKNNKKIQQKEQECIEELNEIYQTININLNNNSVSPYTSNSNTRKFHLNYQGNFKEALPLDSFTIGNALKNNGATTTDGIIYNMTIDGHNYGYDVTTHKLYIDGNDSGMYCRYYMRDDTNLQNITNTVTLAGGSGVINDTRESKRGDPYEAIANKKNKYQSNFFSGVNVAKNSLVIVPYGQRYYEKDTFSGISASTKIGDFMVGQSDSKQVINSLVGFSQGGLCSYETISENPGLYSNLATYGAAGLKNTSQPQSFEDVKIYVFQASETDRKSDGEITFEGKCAKAINYFTENVNNLDLTVYSESNTVKNKLSETSQKYLSKNNSYYELPHEGKWRYHNSGVENLMECGIIGYFSEL